MAIEVFNRYEKKYMLDEHTFRRLLERINDYMEPDKYNLNGQFYSICNIYYDTDDNRLIRSSIEKPVYKEKLSWHNIRTSSYWNIFKLSACFFLIIILLYFTHIGCPIKFITGISCPACGMTRAVLAILHGDTHAALNYHPLVLTLPVLLISVIVYIVNTRRIKPSVRLSRLLNCIFILSAVLFIAVYVLRMLNTTDTIVTLAPSQSILVRLFRNIFK